MPIDEIVEILRRYNPLLADQLVSERMASEKRLGIALHRRGARLDDYRASLWQRLRYREHNVLAKYNADVASCRIEYHACEENLLMAIVHECNRYMGRGADDENNSQI